MDLPFFGGERRGHVVPARLSPGDEPGAAVWWGVLLLLAAVVMAPLAFTEMPPLLDYPSHLARMVVLTAGPDDPVRAIWRPAWSPLPNLAMDLVVPALARVVSVETAGRIFAAVAVVAPPLGTIALHRASFGRRSWWPFVAFGFAWGGTMLAGFLNFHLGIGVALGAAAIWVARFEAGLGERSVVAAVAAPLLYFCHLTALAFFAIIVVALEWAATDRRRFDPWRLAALAPVVAMAALFLLATPAGEATGEAGPASGIVKIFTNPLERLRNFFTPFLGEDPLLDLAGVGLFAVVVIGALRRGGVGRAPEVLWPGVAMLALFPLVPTILMGTGWVDRRVPVLALALVVAGTDVAARAVPGGIRTVAALAAIGVARVGLLAALWSTTWGRDLADLRALAAEVEPGRRVLVVRAQDRGHPRLIFEAPRPWQIMIDVDATIHWPIQPLAVRGAFVPLLHTNHQPIEVAPAHACVALREGQPPHLRILSAPTAFDLARAPYAADWRRWFDYVLLLQAGRVEGADGMLPDRLETIRVSRIAALYRVVRADGSRTPAPACPAAEGGAR